MALGPLQEAWVKALESGEYRQGQGRLVTVMDNQEQCCCLGVLCLMENLEKELVSSSSMEPRYAFGEIYKDQFYLPQELVTKYGFFTHRGEAKGGGTAGEGVSLTYMNDKGDSFAQIAAIVREHPDWFFSEEV